MTYNDFMSIAAVSALDYIDIVVGCRWDRVLLDSVDWEGRLIDSIEEYGSRPIERIFLSGDGKMAIILGKVGDSDDSKESD